MESFTPRARSSLPRFLWSKRPSGATPVPFSVLPGGQADGALQGLGVRGAKDLRQKKGLRELGG